MDPKDLKKYLENHDELSTKHSKKLQKAIRIADQEIKARVPLVQKEREKLLKRINRSGGLTASHKLAGSSVGDLSSYQDKQKPIKKERKLSKLKRKGLNKQKKQKHQPQDQHEHDSDEDRQRNSQHIDQNSDLDSHLQQDFTPLSDRQILSTQRDNQNQHIDTTKIQKYQNQLLCIITNLQQAKAERSQKQAQAYNIFEHMSSHEQFIKTLNANQFTPQQLCQSKLTKMIAYLLKNTPSQPHKSLLLKISNDIKFRIKAHLSDTAYYDTCIKQINKTKSHRQDFSKVIIKILVKHYMIKKELAVIFAQRVSTSINQEKEKQFISDLKEKRTEAIISAITSKASAERIGDQALSKYQ